jgi:hypothetical protein
VVERTIVIISSILPIEISNVVVPITGSIDKVIRILSLMDMLKESHIRLCWRWWVKSCLVWKISCDLISKALLVQSTQPFEMGRFCITALENERLLESSVFPGEVCV